ncbi:LmbE-like protein, partial [Piedraia hortae CBS 480.64]
MVMNWLAVLQVPVLIFSYWNACSYLAKSASVLHGRNISLLIAHPDDEAMFFAPTLLSLTKPELKNQVSIYCLSSGNADGLGYVRQSELYQSALQLGVESGERVTIIDDVKFPDSMMGIWDPELISNELAKNLASINTIITFDERGISQHPNHISLFHGARRFIQQSQAPIQLYTLSSVNIVRKYSSILDSIWTLLHSTWRNFSARNNLKCGDLPAVLVTVSTPADVRRAQKAMTTAHRSQMRWFRWGWIGLSRYMVVNDLQ